jgi:hypothetical protein
VALPDEAALLLDEDEDVCDDEAEESLLSLLDESALLTLELLELLFLLAFFLVTFSVFTLLLDDLLAFLLPEPQAPKVRSRAKLTNENKTFLLLRIESSSLNRLRKTVPYCVPIIPVVGPAHESEEKS